jgi:acyl CoA:acetate/3-ketoacid CoA transferase
MTCTLLSVISTLRGGYDILEADGLTVTEVAPGVDLERDVQDQAHVLLRVSPSLKMMDRQLFSPEVMGLRWQEDGRLSILQ